MLTIDEFALAFDEEPGYLDFARVGPLASVVVDEEAAHAQLLRKARFGSMDSLVEQEQRVQRAVAAATGFRESQIVFQPNTSIGLMEVMFGLRGTVLMSRDEFPSAPFAAVRASESVGALQTRWLDTDYGRVTPGTVREQLTDEVTAVALSLVDFRTGYLADLEGIREVIGDRLLIVDAIQGFSVTETEYTLADIVVSGGQKWVRAGWGTGFLALSDRALSNVSPVLSGFNATDAGPVPVGTVPSPTRGARAFQITNPSPVSQACFSAALEQIESVGVVTVASRVRENATKIIDLADEFGISVISPRGDHDRAGIVVLEPPADRLTALVASLHNHGVTMTAREHTVRLSVHVTTTSETFDMVRSSFQSYATVTSH